MNMATAVYSVVNGEAICSLFKRKYVSKQWFSAIGKAFNT